MSTDPTSTDPTATTDQRASLPPHEPDVVSDPAENTEPGSDWADEGGAVGKAPAED